MQSVKDSINTEAAILSCGISFVQSNYCTFKQYDEYYRLFMSVNDPSYIENRYHNSCVDLRECNVGSLSY